MGVSAVALATTQLTLIRAGFAAAAFS